MTLPREQVTEGLVAELEIFEQLVRSLSPTELSTPSRCDAWTVADVAAHVIGTMTDISQGRLEGQGTPEVTERQVVERGGRSAKELADELREVLAVVPALLGSFDADAWEAPAPGGYDFSLGVGIEALWYDTYVHADDIRAATGRTSEDGDGLWASVSHVAYLLERKGWGPATLALDGLPELDVGAPPGDGTARRVTGDALAFVLTATGRADPGRLGLDPGVNVYA